MVRLRDTRTACTVKDLILIPILKELERHIFALCVLIPMLCSGGEAFSFLATHDSKRAQALWIFCSRLSLTGWPELHLLALKFYGLYYLSTWLPSYVMLY